VNIELKIKVFRLQLTLIAIDICNIQKSQLRLKIVIRGYAELDTVLFLWYVLLNRGKNNKVSFKNLPTSNI
jgi:hypothetical protein